jgi:phytoene/squalene synthetase
LSQTFSILLRERAKRYRAQANEIRAKAERYPNEIRASFLRIAEYWEKLAAEVEAKDERDAAATVQTTRPPESPPTAAKGMASEATG